MNALGVIVSRGETQPAWVDKCFHSIKQQTAPSVVLQIDNNDHKYTIGQALNKLVLEAHKKNCKWLLCVGDDDYISEHYVEELNYFANKFQSSKEIVCITSFMTSFRTEESLRFQPLTRPCTGMWRVEHLLKHKFNETLLRGIDREMFENSRSMGKVAYVINHNFGYYYRKHEEGNASGNIILGIPDTDYVFFARSKNFIEPVVSRMQAEGYSVQMYGYKFEEAHFSKAKVIWCDWADQHAVDVSHLKTDARRFLRVHRYEVFSDYINHIDFTAFEKIFFVSQYILSSLEDVVGPLPQAIVIRNTVDLGKFTLNKELSAPHICYAGTLNTKKAIGELYLIARAFPGLKFTFAGKTRERDVGHFLYYRKPDNVTLEPFSYDLDAFFKDKTHFLLASIIEGCPNTPLEAMACGVTPVVRAFIGSEDYLPENFLWEDMGDLQAQFTFWTQPKVLRAMIEKDFNFEPRYKQILEYIT